VEKYFILLPLNAVPLILKDTNFNNKIQRFYYLKPHAKDKKTLTCLHIGFFVQNACVSTTVGQSRRRYFGLLKEVFRKKSGMLQGARFCFVSHL
jgi:hypothetical protein